MSRSLRILQVHNKYRPGLGGEDSVADLEAGLLSDHGHEVRRLIVSTAELNGSGPLRLARAGIETVWSFRGYSEIRQAIRDFSPDILHAHNIFPLLSPSIFWAAHRGAVPVVQTLHNFRFTCANAFLLRDGKPCQDCVAGSSWPALRYRCFGQSLLQTGAVTAMNSFHRSLGTFRDKIHSYIVLNEFTREIMVRSGLPAQRVFVKPNFTRDFSVAPRPRLPQLVFVGEISPHKGVNLLLQTWSAMPHDGHRLVLLGDGKERTQLEREYAGDSSIEFRGWQPHEQVLQTVAASRFLVLPSLCYENLPISVLEAFSLATPVIVPNHGAFPHMVAQHREGLLFSPGEASALTAAIREALAAGDASWSAWSRHARDAYLQKYTEAGNYEQLMAIYHNTIEYCMAGSAGFRRATVAAAASRHS